MNATLRTAAGALALLGLTLAGCGGDAERRVQRTGPAVAVIGDTPYGADQVANFRTDIATINADPDVRLVIHLGDIQEGPSRCTNAYLERIRRDFDSFDDPLVYTPGDNEWTDCHDNGLEPWSSSATGLRRQRREYRATRTASGSTTRSGSAAPSMASRRAHRTSSASSSRGACRSPTSRFACA
jgi:hypothetical protein